MQLSGHGPQAENHFSYLVSATRQTGVEVRDPIFNLGSAAYITWNSFATSYQGVALIPK